MPKDNKIIIIYITYPDLKTAKKIVAALMDSRLIACGNFFPVQSTYWWKGRIENSKEVVSIVKTKIRNWEKVRSAVIKLHPYETPCIMKINVEINDGFGAWISQEVR